MTHQNDVNSKPKIEIYVITRGLEKVSQSCLAIEAYLDRSTARNVINNKNALAKIFEPLAFYNYHQVSLSFNNALILEPQELIQVIEELAKNRVYFRDTINNNLDKRWLLFPYETI